MPKLNSVREFEGAYFVTQGPYNGAILRFIVLLPTEYPKVPPSIRIISRMPHPLVGADKLLLLPSVQKGSRLCHSLAALAQAFDELFLYGLEEEHCIDKETLKLLKTDRIAFDELIAGSIQESVEFAKTAMTGSIALGAPLPPQLESFDINTLRPYGPI